GATGIPATARPRTLHLRARCVPDLRARCVPDPRARCVPDPRARRVPAATTCVLHGAGPSRKRSILAAVKHSEFQQAMRDCFGAYASSLAQDMVLAPLGSKTADEALAEGVPPGRLREAVGTVNDLGDEARWHRRGAQPRKS